MMNPRGRLILLRSTFKNATNGAYRYFRMNDKKVVEIGPILESLISWMLKLNLRSFMEMTRPVSIIIRAAILNLFVRIVNTLR